MVRKMKPNGMSTNGVTSLMADVALFHEACGIPVRQCAGEPDPKRVALRQDLITEEYEETMVSLQAILAGYGGDGEICDLADGLADLICVCIGCALEFGIPLDRVWAEVQRSNMDKTNGPVREDGKVLKPPGWVGPDIHGALFGKAVE